ncbi:Pollen Ole e 1 allergen/extensin [Macleaya cordata]|uniref:Pollen Ole e 1 allergen/extensin n=1 Tax=Macleaya cordata TaxID=56857 RepID=A0A200QBB1_MACCD|nr:Pollen Ole e 1 allergen/extensin [Macleaya cordata]
MAFIKVLVALQLLMFFMSLTTVTSLGVEVDTLVGGGGSGLHLPPVPPPVAAPAMAPVAAPVAVPVPSPISKLPIRKPIAVQGVVFCKPCKYAGKDTLQDASPLPGAIVKMVCENAKSPRSPIVRVVTTDKHGYFFILPTKRVTSYGAQKRCRVFLALPPKGSNCTNPTYLNWGKSGAYLKPTKPTTPVEFALYSVGPFAFEPVCSKD